MTTRNKDTRAFAIANDLLDRSGHAIMTRDFDVFADCMFVPHTISNFDESFLVKDRGALKRGFFQFCDHFDMINVTKFIRVCVAAEFIDDDTLHFTHVSHLMSGNLRVKEPYPCFTIVDAIGGNWMMSASDYAIRAATHQARAIKSANEIRPPGDKTQSAKAAGLAHQRPA